MGTVAYQPVKDFAPVSQVAVLPLLLVVHNNMRAKSVEELVALARAQPGALTFAPGGTGSTPHMAAELFKFTAGIDIRPIPYKAVLTTAIPDLLAGRVTMMFGGIGVLAPLAREGKLRALAVTSSRRPMSAPELPTVAESGYPGFDFTQWYGLLAPARTPATIVRTLHVETARALARSELRAKFAEYDLVGNSPEEFAAFIKSEISRWTMVIKQARIKPD
jgi:tripartite-type tricarboxylate transporter receptor subunit TctC